jgi:hypothetical protein
MHHHACVPGAFTAKLAGNFSAFAKSFTSDAPQQEEEQEEEAELDKVKNDSDVVQQKRTDALRARARSLFLQL